MTTYNTYIKFLTREIILRRSIYDAIPSLVAGQFVHVGSFEHDGPDDELGIAELDHPLMAHITEQLREEYGIQSLQFYSIKYAERQIVDSNRYLLFSTRNRMNSGYAVDTTSLSLTKFASKLKFHCPQYKTRSPRFHYCGYAMGEGGTDVGAPQESTLPGNSFTIDSTWIIYNGVWYRGHFRTANADSVVITSGGTGDWAEFPTFTGDFDPEASFYVLTLWHVDTVGQKFVGAYRHQTHRNEKYWGANTDNDLWALIDADAPTTAVLDNFYNIVPGNQTNSQLISFGPDIMVAKGDWDGRPIVLCPCDSIGHSRNEVSASAEERGTLGWLDCWLDRDDEIYGRFPHLIFGSPGAASYRDMIAPGTYSGGAGSLKRYDALDEVKAWNANNAYPFTHGLNQAITNDANSVFSTFNSRVNGFAVRFKARYPNAKFGQCTVMPQISSSLSYVTAASITTAAQWQNSGNRGTINTSIRNYGLHNDFVIDIDSVVIDPDFPDKWLAAEKVPAIGKFIQTLPGDGVSRHPTTLTDFEPDNGACYVVNYQPNLWARRDILSWSPANNGYHRTTMFNTYTTVFQNNAQVLVGVSSDGIHPLPSYRKYRIVPSIPTSFKAAIVNAVTHA